MGPVDLFLNQNKNYLWKYLCYIININIFTYH